MVETIDTIEKQRLALQAMLDRQKTAAERNRLGQFATPTALAQDMLKHAFTLFPPGEKVHFLDPAIGTGAFYSALRSVFPDKQIADAMGFEIDPHYGETAARLWKSFGLTLSFSDFTHASPSPRFNLVICNPPYVRHHYLLNGDKSRLQRLTLQASGMRVSGLAGLYCHFLGLSNAWMTKDGIAGWLIPSEFMDVNYGQAIKHYLIHRVTLLRIHRFDPNEVQFADALVSSAIVWFRNVPPPPDHAVTFSFGGTLLEPKLSRSVLANVLADEPKWTRFPAADIRSRGRIPTLSDFFRINRGVATGDNSYFILTETDIKARGLPITLFQPVLPSPRYVPEDEIKADNDGNPDLERRLFLLDTRLNEAEIKTRYPTLWTYLEQGKLRGLHERYLCRHRSPWYAQENRLPAPIVCTYLGRSDTKRVRPFRFILNGSRATVANVYLAMYPTPLLVCALARDPALIRRIWRILNALTPDQLLGEGRVYGGGLHKLEPRELANVDASAIAELVPDFRPPVSAAQLEIFSHEHTES
ncbi:MAG: Eco57I restriction-modification methylase domain-containing protein [Gammaproteobacteria bacterium]